MTDYFNLQHMVWVLDDDYDPLGVASAVTDYGQEPESWQIRVRPEGVGGDRWWEFTDLGLSESKHDAIDTIRQNATEEGGNQWND